MSSKRTFTNFGAFWGGLRENVGGTHSGPGRPLFEDGEGHGGGMGFGEAVAAFGDRSADALNTGIVADRRRGVVRAVLNNAA